MSTSSVHTRETYQDLEPGYTKESVTFTGNSLEVNWITSHKSDTEYLICKECDDIKETLLAKNRKYGNSAISRGVVFDIDPVTAIKARLNDKISRWKNDNKDEDEDISKDILGYIILLRIAQKQVS
jgi:hypothetical protein